MRLPVLAEVINQEFGLPFLEDGIVKAEYIEKDDTLRLTIGQRNIHIDSGGTVLGSGSRLDQRLILQESDK